MYIFKYMCYVHNLPVFLPVCVDRKFTCVLFSKPFLVLFFSGLPLNPCAKTAAWVQPQKGWIKRHLDAGPKLNVEPEKMMVSKIGISGIA